MSGGTEALPLLMNVGLGLLWFMLGLAGVLWLATVGGLLRGAADMVLRRAGTTKVQSRADARFLRSMHIQA